MRCKSSVNIGKAVISITFERGDYVSKELTVKRMISFNGPDGDYVDFDTITEEQKETFRKSVGERMSVILSNMAPERIYRVKE